MIGKLLARRGILSKREQEIRVREQELLQRLATALERFGSDVAADDLRRFQEAREQLNGLFLLVIAGEFNSGKSSFINALLGERVLPEGVTPTTDRINVLRHGPEVSEQLREAYLLERTHPAEPVWLLAARFVGETEYLAPSGSHWPRAMLCGWLRSSIPSDARAVAACCRLVRCDARAAGSSSPGPP